MTSPAQKLARELADLRRQVTSLSRGSQMSRRSLEGGGVPIYDVDGVYRGSVGMQTDGTTALVTTNDPVPPTPSTPILIPAPGGLEVEWDGTFQDGAERPKDLRQMEVHAAVGVYTTSQATRRAFLPINGSRVFVALPSGDPYSVCFIAVTTGDSRSAPSGLAIETPAAVAVPGDVVGVTGANADLVASVDDTGRISGQTLTVTDGDPIFGGVSLSERDWERPWGVVGNADVIGPVDAYWCTPRTNGEVGLAEFAFVAQPGRKYELISEPFELRTSTGDTAFLRIRRTTNGTAPTVTSTILREYVVAPIRDGFAGSRSFAAVFNGPAIGTAAQTYRLLMSYGVGDGSTGVSAGVRDRTFRFIIRDIGPLRPNVAVYSAGGGSVVTGEAPPPPPPTDARTTRTQQWLGTWSRSWRQNGSIRTDVGSAMYQGYVDSFNGIQQSAWAWPDLVGTLSGAEINKVEMWLNCEHAYYNSGVEAWIGGHPNLNAPAGFPGQGTPIQVHFGKPEGKWITLGPEWYAGIKSGATRGATLFINNTNPLHYGRFTGVGVQWQPGLRITYTK